MIVISNSGPIIALAKVGLLHLLKHYFNEVHLSKATYHELAERGSGRTGAEEIKRHNWIKTKEIKDEMAAQILALELDRGEAETIVLAHELKANLTLLDETIARKIANLLGLRVKGTLGILVLAKKDNLIKELKPILEELRTKGVWLSDEVCDEALRLVGEK